MDQKCSRVKDKRELYTGGEKWLVGGVLRRLGVSISTENGGGTLSPTQNQRRGVPLEKWEKRAGKLLYFCLELNEIFGTRPSNLFQSFRDHFIR